MSDFIDLAKLPLSTILLIAFLYVVFLYVKWAWDAYRVEEKEAAFVHRLRCQVAFNFGVFLEAYRDNEVRMADDAKAIAEGKTRSSVESWSIERLLDTLIWGQSRPEPSANPVGVKPMSTEGFMLYDEVQSQFHRMDDKEAGLALYFIEQHALVYQTIAALGTKIKEKATLGEQEKTRKRLHKALADAIVVCHALLTPQVREALHPGPSSLPPKPHVPDKSPQQVLAEILDLYPTEAEGQTPDMYVAAYRVLEVKPVKVNWWPLAVVPAVFAVVIVAVLSNDDLNAFFFPSAGTSVACETTTWPGGGQSTKCAYTAESLKDAMRQRDALGAE